MSEHSSAKPPSGDVTDPDFPPALLALVQEFARGGDTDPVERMHAAALAPLRHLWAEEVRNLREAGIHRSAMKAALERVKDRVAEFRETRDRLNALREAATEAANNAALLHAEALVKHGGKPTDAGRAADAAATAAAATLSEAELNLGRDLDAAAHGDALIADAEANLAEANMAVSEAIWHLGKKRAAVIHQQILIVGGVQISPLLGALDVTLRATRALTGAYPPDDRDLRTLARDGARFEPIGSTRQAEEKLVSSIRKAGGVDEHWRGPRPEGLAVASVMATTPLPERPRGGHRTTF
ncbi:hypothetical protein [Neoroseomonas oryzicola]|uniref:Uncharacterized protein n=1 Tax=Neoroseomonas oryzicola TaxID=535904 RepID=A0A9X9WDG2_9PROT|nr:hypothetical protein [Neoroseomonas oryzicola]MBR0658372.1 hypothetical protein [Neoroseomonas oryzicola]NKE18537.1 hypothetical protein [Neoroseomonas oryzicola]